MIKFKYLKVGDEVKVTGGDDKSHFKYLRIGDEAKFTFKGKTPPRRILRDMVKMCERLSE